jgi:eukaryotic-like serine/threonine-protein kinase
VVERELVANRYELGEQLGSGGMSSVYRAFDTQLERHVALKILHDRYGSDQDHVDRFRREARAVAQLSHPHVVTVIDRGDEDGRQFIVFELVDGEDLKALVERGGPLPVRRVLELGLEIGAALAFAHGQGLVHRDVKPQNVLLDGEGRAKVTDFGIVRSLEAVGTTETGTVLGTSHYVAPEQARGEKVDAKTDVYSFGVVLFELLAGEVPYSGDSFVAVALRHANDPVPDVLERRPDTPLRLAALVGRCLAKSPADRPSMDEVVAELTACLAELDAKEGEEATMIVRRPAVAAPRQRQTPSRQSRRRLLLPVALAALLLAAVIGVVLLARGDDDASEGGGGGGVVRLQGVASFDPPPGDGEEHDERVADATDGDLATYWTTETYQAFTKPGVGLVLDAGSARALERVELTSDTPGFTAEIHAGDTPEGPFEKVADGTEAGPETTWELDGDEARYYVVWITALDRVAHVNEVTAS